MMNQKMRVLVPQKHISRNLTSGSPLSSSAGVPVMGTLWGTRRTFLKREELQGNILYMASQKIKNKNKFLCLRGHPVECT